jgi:hypothetical protein
LAHTDHKSIPADIGQDRYWAHSTGRYRSGQILGTRYRQISVWTDMGTQYRQILVRTDIGHTVQADICPDRYWAHGTGRYRSGQILGPLEDLGLGRSRASWSRYLREPFQQINSRAKRAGQGWTRVRTVPLNHSSRLTRARIGLGRARRVFKEYH